MRCKYFAILALSIGPLCAAAQAGTVTLGFEHITNTSATNIATGESQLKMTISMMGSAVNFHFFHDGAAAGAITQVYFDDRSPLLGAAMLSSSGAGVVFSENGAPPVLPGGTNASPSFVETRRFTANSPPPVKGISTGEFLDIKFALLSGDFDSVIADIMSGDLRVGIHVQSFANGLSESFINGQPSTNPIPLPTPVTLAGAGLIGVMAIRRRRAG